MLLGSLSRCILENFTIPLPILIFYVTYLSHTWLNFSFHFFLNTTFGTKNFSHLQSQRTRMENLTIKSLDMIFLTDLRCMNIIRLLLHQKTQKKLKRPKNFLKAKSKATIQFHQILTIFWLLWTLWIPKFSHCHIFYFKGL